MQTWESAVLLEGWNKCRIFSISEQWVRGMTNVTFSLKHSLWSSMPWLITPQLQMSSSGSGARLGLWNRQILQLTPFFCHINWCWSVLTDAWLSTSFEADKQFCVMTRNWGWCQGLAADELQCDTYWDVSSWGQFLQLGDYSGLAQCSVTSSLHHSSLN